jgi:FPC/CPF motif-containing protein YcgG
MTNTFKITVSDQKQWKCITAAASFEKSQIYITNFYDLRKEGEKDFNYAQY